MSGVFDSDSLRAYKKKTNFFETPAELADKMAALLSDVGRNARILEPSAGRGALIDAVYRNIRYPIQPISFCEIQDEFVEILTAKRAVKVASDFEKYTPETGFDGVIMNPPFANRRAEIHLERAWNCIRPGGMIVALVGIMAKDWVISEFEGHIFEMEEIPRNTFFETNIATCLFQIGKPLDGGVNLRQWGEEEDGTAKQDTEVFADLPLFSGRASND